jgi:hypothetical protein
VLFMLASVMRDMEEMQKGANKEKGILRTAAC